MHFVELGALPRKLWLHLRARVKAKKGRHFVTRYRAVMKGEAAPGLGSWANIDRPCEHRHKSARAAFDCGAKIVRRDILWGGDYPSSPGEWYVSLHLTVEEVALCLLAVPIAAAMG